MIKNILISLFIGFILLISTVPSFFITELSIKEEGTVSVLDLKTKEENIDVLAIIDELQKYKDSKCNLLEYEIDYDNLLGYNKKEKVFNVQIYCSELKIDDEIYYFKSREESEKFKNQINKIKEKEAEIAEIIISTEEKFTTQEELDNKIAAVKEEKRKEDEEAKRIKEEQERQQRLLLAKTEIVSSRSSGARVYSSGNSQHPLDSYTYISSNFGWRSRGFHTGVDFAVSSGTEVHAWKPGMVIHASWSGGYGNYIQIQHDDGTISCYAHLSGYACSVGDYVECHEVIGYVGSTGNSTRPSFTFWNKN